MNQSSSRLTLSGPLVMSTIGALLPQGTAATTTGDLIVDFTATTDIDSSALALLMQWRRAAETAGHQVTLEQVPHNLQVLADLYGVSFLLSNGNPAP